MKPNALIFGLLLGCLALTTVAAQGPVLQQYANPTAPDSYDSDPSLLGKILLALNANGAGTSGMTVVGAATIGQTMTSANGTDFATLANVPANQCRMVNMTGTILEIRRGSTGYTFPLPANATYTFRALSNVNQLQVRRVDQAATPVVVNYEAEKAVP